MAFIKFISGPMFAGKSSRLIHYATKMSKSSPIIVFKPAFDVRYSNTEIISHNGQCYPAINFNEQVDVPENAIIFLDEIQFFSEDIIDWIQKKYLHGHSFIISGLNLDYKGNPFTISEKVSNIATSIEFLFSECAICGGLGEFSHKLNESEKLFELGSSDLYQPRCKDHFL